MKRYLLVGHGKRGQTTAALFESLATKLKERYRVSLRLSGEGRGSFPRPIRKIFWIIPNLFHLRDVVSCDVFVTHTTAVLCFHEIILAHLLRKRIVIFLWDVYPDSIVYTRGGTLTRSLRLFGTIENFLLDRADVVLVTNSDYFDHPTVSRLKRSGEFMLWPSQSHALPVSRRAERSGPLTVAFAGQINRIRDVHGAARRLIEVTERKIELHIFSRDSFEPDGEHPPLASDRIEIIQHGFLPDDELAVRLNKFDAGLISLSPDFPLPAFPSKIFAYMDAGIPVLFHGPAGSAVHDFVKETGVGLSLDVASELPIDDAILRLKERLPEARERFSELTQLSWSRLDTIL